MCVCVRFFFGIQFTTNSVLDHSTAVIVSHCISQSSIDDSSCRRPLCLGESLNANTILFNRFKRMHFPSGGGGESDEVEGRVVERFWENILVHSLVCLWVKYETWFGKFSKGSQEGGWILILKQPHYNDEMMVVEKSREREREKKRMSSMTTNVSLFIFWIAFYCILLIIVCFVFFVCPAMSPQSRAGESERAKNFWVHIRGRWNWFCIVNVSGRILVVYPSLYLSLRLPPLGRQLVWRLFCTETLKVILFLFSID